MKHLNKQSWSILIGNMLDHYDTALYGFLVPILSPLFFPTNATATSLILGYLVLIISFFSAPIGAYIFGMLAKYRGATFSLSYSLIFLSCSTVIIGLLPTHGQVGITAPILLVIARMLQSICAAGECSVAKLYILEGNSEVKSSNISQIYQFSSILGIILASCLTTIIYMLPQNNIYWRLCFFLGGLTGTVGYYLRTASLGAQQNNISASVLFPKNDNLAIYKLLWQYRQYLPAILLTGAFGHVTYYIPFIFMNSFVPLVTDISLKTMMELNSLLLILDAGLILIIGRLIERYNSRVILLTTCLLFAMTIIPIIYYIQAANSWYIVLARVWIILLGVIFSCTLTLWYKSLNFGDNQYLITGLAGSLGTNIIGKSAPAISIALWHYTESTVAIGIYLAIIALLTSYNLFYLKLPTK